MPTSVKNLAATNIKSLNKDYVGYHILYFELSLKIHKQFLAHESFTRGYLKLQQMLLLSTKVQKSFLPIQNVHVHFSLVLKWTPNSIECYT